MVLSNQKCKLVLPLNIKHLKSIDKLTYDDTKLWWNKYF